MTNSFITYGAEESKNPIQTWWDHGWTGRQRLVFDNSGQSETLTNFPVMIELSTANFDYSMTKNDGTDLRFIDADGTTDLNYYIDTWDDTGCSYVWVNVSSITAGSSTDNIWMYYGNSSAGNVQSILGTYGSQYQAVYHLDELAGTVYDTTSNSNDGVPAGGVGQGAEGVVSKGAAFDGDDDIITVLSSDSLNITDEITLSLWLNATFSDKWSTIETTAVVFGDSVTMTDKAEGTTCPAIGDVDGDGELEIVLGTSDNDLVVYNFTGGSIDEEARYSTGDKIKSPPAIADVDDDGVLEIIFGSDDANLYVLNHTGAALNLEDSAPLGDKAEGSHPAIVDIDDDGTLEIIIACKKIGDDVYVFNHDGATLNKEDSIDIGDIDVKTSMGIADVDNDGVLEIIFGAGDNKLYVYNHNGVSMALEASHAVGDMIEKTYPAIGDVDRDGQLEIIIGCDLAGDDLYVFNHTGSALNIEDSVNIDNVDDIKSPVALGDIDNDGDLEIVFGRMDGFVYVYNHKNSVLTLEATFNTGGDIQCAPALVDVDNDGRLEIIIGNNNGIVNILNHTGGATLGQETTYSTAGKAVIGSPIIADVDNDGLLEIIITSTSGGPGGKCTLHILDTNSASSTTWEMYGGNLNHSGSFDCQPKHIVSKNNSYGLNAGYGSIIGSLNGETTGASLSSGWNYVSMSYNGSSLKMFTNGIETASAGISGPIITNANNLIMGLGTECILDEITIASKARSASWLRAEYLAMTGNFITFGATESHCKNTGAAYIFYGFSGMSPNDLNASRANVTIYGTAANGHLGWDVAGGYNIDGQGNDDIVIGAPGWQSNTGAAYVFSSATLMAAGDPGVLTAADADMKLTGRNTGDRFASSVASSGDINGDGRGDILIGAWNRDLVGTDAGMAYVFFGKSSLPGSITAQNADVRMVGKNAGDNFGWSVEGIGDINSDGNTDLSISAPGWNSNQGRVYIFHGGPGLASNIEETVTTIGAPTITTGTLLSGTYTDTHSYSDTTGQLYEEHSYTESHEWVGIDIPADENITTGVNISGDYANLSSDDGIPRIIEESCSGYTTTHMVTVGTIHPGDTTGEPINDLKNSDNADYSIDKGDTMYIDSWDVGGLSGGISSLNLTIEYSAGGGPGDYEGDDILRVGLDGEPDKDTNIMIVDAPGDILLTDDLLQYGIDSLDEIATMDVSLTDTCPNNKKIEVDYLNLTITTYQTSSLNVTYLIDGISGSEDVYELVLNGFRQGLSQEYFTTSCSIDSGAWFSVGPLDWTGEMYRQYELPSKPTSDVRVRFNDNNSATPPGREQLIIDQLAVHGYTNTSTSGSTSIMADGPGDEVIATGVSNNGDYKNTSSDDGESREILEQLTGMATVSDVILGSKDAGDDTGEALNSIQITDGTTYDVDNLETCWFDSFDTAGLSGGISAVNLSAYYKTEGGSMINQPLMFAVEETNFQSTGLLLRNTANNLVWKHTNLFSRGVDTISEIAGLDIKLYNQDPASKMVKFDYINLTVTTFQAAALNVTYTLDNVGQYETYRLVVDGGGLGLSETNFNMYYDIDGADTWTHFGTLNTSYDRRFNVSLAAVPASNVRVRILDNQTDAPPNQNGISLDMVKLLGSSPYHNLSIGYDLEFSVKPATPSFDLFMYLNVSDVMGESIGIMAFNYSSSNWDYTGSSVPISGSPKWINLTLASGNYTSVSGQVKIRLNDTTFTNDHPGRLFIDYLAIHRLDQGFDANITISGEAGSSRFGHAVSHTRDSNLDGIADLIVGAPEHNGATGRAYVFYGSTTMSSTIGADTGANVTMTGADPGDRFGFAVSSLGNTTGAGHSDIAIGAPFHDDVSLVDAGAIYLFLSNGSMVSTLTAADADFIIKGTQAGQCLGWSLANVTEMGGGNQGFFTGAPFYDTPTGDIDAGYVEGHVLIPEFSTFISTGMVICSVLMIMMVYWRRKRTVIVAEKGGEPHA